MNSIPSLCENWPYITIYRDELNEKHFKRRIRTHGEIPKGGCRARLSSLVSNSLTLPTSFQQGTSVHDESSDLIQLNQMNLKKRHLQTCIN